ncbi:alpha/beta fold hydrolase [Alteromonas lipolytica]|uniref:Alpha/beta hydrolase n=1 Tax=Alteromonas lipolytica TaxID=1856405 RepID=A0A1E8FFN4_9ALTE|nr:alpha/beta hydrolase [Alteromonas lipolytica]OFI34709.1 alpha/beta hydrolase [Alteromonas lipolytica]GGF53370.1 alpha/beta hydrolase [Alteromonas lipolytica]
MQECEFKLSTGTLRGLTNGRSGPLVLALHGFLDNAASMACLAPYLEQFQFIALDLPGHGMSDHRPKGGQYNQMDYVQDIHELVVSQDWQDIIIVGHSMGGILASLYAAAFSDYVKAIALIDAGGPLTLPAETSAEQLRASILSRLPKNKPQSGAKEVDLQAAIAARCKTTDILPEHAQTILQRNICVLESGVTGWRSDPRLRTKSSLRLTEAQAQNLMEAIECPVWIGGASDSFKEMESTYEKRKTWLKNSRFELFSGGHHFHMSKPSAVCKSICEFVEEM